MISFDFVKDKLHNKYNRSIDLLNELVIYLFGKKWNIVLINEYPKCGASWLRNLLSEILDVNKNRGNWNENKRMGFVGKNSIIQRHWKKNVNCKTIIIIRDPRDVLTSFFFFENYYLKNKVIKKSLNFDTNGNDKINFERYIKYKIEKPELSTPGFSYEDFWNFYKNRDDVLIVKYEDLRNDTFDVVKNILEFLGYNNISGDKITSVISQNTLEKLRRKEKLQKGQSSFYRKGIVGDWNNYYSDDLKRYLTEKYGKLLTEMGYE